MAPLTSTVAELDALKWRCIGPPRGGRVVAVAGDPQDRSVFYFGACAGGVWKTVDGGVYWRCGSGGFFRPAPVGALEVSCAGPQGVFSRTRETAVPLHWSYGDGGYKTTGSGPPLS